MTSCDSADINYNLCQVLVDRIAEQQQRLDLVWWGVWGAIGLLLVLVVASVWFRSWRMLR